MGAIYFKSYLIYIMYILITKFPSSSYIWSKWEIIFIYT